MLIAVGPQDVPGLLADIASHLRHDRLLVSALAGVPTRLFERYVADDTPVVRAMPNTPVLVGAGRDLGRLGRHRGLATLPR
ncbi:pyrroline-5-carboxylate reductase family protein [Streptomyces sp. NPDC058525]|uniref:pyrroline-5-carboxylate reductase family protein n=1 Tax=unclassified Streptomyces TaxID=2593676 RepID=UPI0036557A41